MVLFHSVKATHISYQKTPLYVSFNSAGLTSLRYNGYRKEYYGSFLKTLLKDSYNAEEKWGTGKRMRAPFLKMHKGRAHRSDRARGGRI